MNDNLNVILKPIKLLPKYVQALQNDAMLFFADEPTLATPERKVMLVKNIKLMQAQLGVLENFLTQDNAQC
jgi:hypothetical protein